MKETAELGTREQLLQEKLEERYRRKLEPILGKDATSIIIKMLKEDSFYQLGTAALVVKRIISSGENYPGSDFDG